MKFQIFGPLLTPINEILQIAFVTSAVQNFDVKGSVNISLLTYKL